MLFRLIPYLRLPNVFFPVIGIPFGQMVCHIFFHSQRSQAVLCKCNASLKFLNHLIRPHHQMPFCNRKLAHSGKSVHFPGILCPEQSGSLAHPVRKIAIGLLCIFIDEILERTGHGPKGIDFLILFLIP